MEFVLKSVCICFVKKEADAKIWDKISHAVGNDEYNFETKYVANAKTREITVITEVEKDNIVNKFGLVINVPEEAITTTLTSEIKAQMAAYALSVLNSATCQHP